MILSEAFFFFFFFLFREREALLETSQGIANKWRMDKGAVQFTLKTEVIMFSKATSIVKHLPNRLIIGNHRVPFGFKAKYLGVTLDSKLTWQPHINNAINRAKQYLRLRYRHR